MTLALRARSRRRPAAHRASSRSQITGARYGALGVLDEDGETIERFITEGISDEVRAAIGHPPVGHGILGLLIRERRPDAAPRPRSGPSVATASRRTTRRCTRSSALRCSRSGRSSGTSTSPRSRAPRCSATMTRPRSSCSRRRPAWRSRTRGCTPRRSARSQELRRLEVLEERERIAKELHDGVIQSLFAVGMGLQGTAGMARDDDLSAPDRRRRRGDRPGDPRSAQLHLRAAARHPRRPPARPGAEGARQTSSRRGPTSSRSWRSTAGVAAELASRAGRHRAAHARGPVQRGAPRAAPRRAASRLRRTSERRRAGDRRRRDRLRPRVSAHGDGARQPRGSGRGPGRHPHDREHRGRRHDAPRHPRSSPREGPAMPAPSSVGVIRCYCTTSAVTMPYMPCGPSTWGRMWQWNAHAPGWSACTSTSKR